MISSISTSGSSRPGAEGCERSAGVAAFVWELWIALAGHHPPSPSQKLARRRCGGRQGLIGRAARRHDPECAIWQRPLQLQRFRQRCGHPHVEFSSGVRKMTGIALG